MTATERTPHSWRPHKNSRLIGGALIVYFLLITFPGQYVPLGPAGIDPGWKWAVNQARGAGLIFGEDHVFTYGPLGYLVVPLDIDSNLILGNLFALLMHLIFGAALWRFHAREQPLAPLLIGLLLLALAQRQQLAPEGLLLLIVGFVIWVGLRHGERRWLLLGSGLTGLFFLIKLSLGVAALTLLLAAALLAQRDRRGLRVVAELLLPMTAIFCSLALATIGSPAAVLRWLSRSAEIVSGYSVANSLVGPPFQLLLGVALLIVWLIAAVASRRDPRHATLNGLFALGVLLQFRLGFVRQDGHVHQFFGFMLALLALSILISRGRREIGGLTAAYAALLVIASLVSGWGAGSQAAIAGRLYAGVDGGARISKLLRLASTREELARQSRANLASLRLPEELVQTLRAAPEGVGTLPWEISYCPANDLRWNPTPTLQLYSAYTSSLDLWSASHYSGARAPRFILNDWAPVGRRHQLLDAPATWREIFLHYEPRSFFRRPELAILERREQPLRPEYRELARETIPLETAKLPVPDSPHLLFAELELELSLAGRLQKTLFRIPPLYLVLHYASGADAGYRMVPDTARNGLLINRFPASYEEYLQLWSGVNADPVVGYTISGPGSYFYKQPLQLVWRELRLQQAG